MMKIPNLQYYLALFSLIIITSCSTTLDVKCMGDGKGCVNNGPQQGVLYSLPMTQFEITVIRRVASCDNNTMKVATEFEIKKGAIDDPSNTFLIDPTSLSHFWNKATTKIEFHEGGRRIKSFNGSVTDNVAPTVISIVKAISSTSGVGALDDPDEKLICKTNPDIDKLIKDSQTQKNVVKELTKTLNQQIQLVSRVTAEQTSILPGKDPKVDAKVAAAIKHMKALKGQLEQEEKLLVGLLKPITYTQKIVWPEAGDEMKRAKPVSMPEKELAKWAEMGASPDKKTKQLDIYLSLEPIKSCDSDCNNHRTNKPGLYYRVPASGVLVFKDQGEKIIHKHDDVIAQLGYVNSIKISAGAFESMEFSATYNDDGSLKDVGYTQAKSASEEFTSILDGAVEVRNARQEQKSNAEQAALDKKLKQLQAEVAIKEASEKLNPPENSGEKALEALNAETALLTAEIARLEAEKKLVELRGN